MSMELSHLRQLGKRFFKRTNIMAAILCFDHVFRAISPTTGVSSQQAMENLPILLEYIRLLTLNPSEFESIRKLLGIQELSRNYFLIPTETTFFTVLKQLHMFTGSSSDEGTRISGRELPQAAKIFLHHRLRHPLSLVTTVNVLRDWPLPTSLPFVR
jgi:hypothetical protein